jgi:hypothetical protein
VTRSHVAPKTSVRVAPGPVNGGETWSFADEKLDWKVVEWAVKRSDFPVKSTYLHYGLHKPLIESAHFTVYGADPETQDRQFVLGPKDIASYRQGRVRYETDEVILEIESDKKFRFNPLSVLL